ncbi:transposase, partial [Caproiciproducens sp. MSJ-32]|uniref:transposase n=1 Tax=Caproiciproducens sp. MSJ-32 TaxID=2841527 RepID=UPI001C10DEF2
LLISKVELMEEELSAKDKEIQQLKNEIAFLKGIISNKNRKIFGTSSEQVDANQLSLFNEAEKHSDSKVEEPTLEEITYKRAKKNNYAGKKDNLANLERVVIEHKLEGEDLKCKECGEELIEIGIKSKIERIVIPLDQSINKIYMYSKDKAIIVKLSSNDYVTKLLEALK